MAVREAGLGETSARPASLGSIVEERSLALGRVSLMLGIVAILYTAAYAARLAWSPETFQVNLIGYYYAAQTHAAGQNPYNDEIVNAHVPEGRGHGMQFVYSPPVLLLLRPLTLLDYETAWYVYFALKLCALVYVMALWMYAFLGRRFDGLFLALSVIAFNYALLWDLQVGNTDLFVSAALWTGFLCFRNGRWVGFILAVAFAALFKLTPVFFLGLLVFEWREVAWKRVTLTCVLIAAAVGLHVALRPILYLQYLDGLFFVPGLPTDGDASTDAMMFYPSTLALIKSFFAAAAARIALPSMDLLSKLCFLAVAGGTLAVSAFCGRWPLGLEARPRREALIFLACFCYLLILPRIVVYSFGLVVLPAYVLALRLKPANSLLLLFAIMAVSTIPGRPTGFSFLVVQSAPFYPLLCVWFLWALMLFYLYGVRMRSRTAQLPGPARS